MKKPRGPWWSHEAVVRAIAVVGVWLVWKFGRTKKRNMIEEGPVMNTAFLESAILVALRMLWPVIGGAAVVSEGELQKVAGAMFVIGSIAYHAWRRVKGQERDERR